MKDGLSNKQFLTIACVIVICGIAILGHDYFLSKKTTVYEKMSILLSQEPEVVEPVPDEPDTTIVTTTEPPAVNNAGDTSGKVKKINTTYNYAGRLKIPAIKLNRGFVRYGQRGNNVNQNIAIMSGSTYPDIDGSNFIIAAHSGNGWNAFFGKLDKLKKGSMAYVTYNGKQYSYKLTNIYSDIKSDGKISVYNNPAKKQLTLVTCKRPDYKKYYLVLVFELVNEIDL